VREALERIRAAALDALESLTGEDELEALRIRFVGKKGELTSILRGMRDVPPEERPAVGELVNAVKLEVEGRIEALRERLLAEKTRRSLAQERVDVTVPGARFPEGRPHPLMRVMAEVVEIFVAMGFEVADGPEVEDDYHNFEALNFPADHPARDMQDTLFVEGGKLLRTHTSPVQIRVMEARKPPLRVVVPGVLASVLRQLFGEGTPVRFRPSFFPFTEPSAEIDIGCVFCGASGRTADGAACRVCKGTTWLEILGSGMIDPNVFRFVGYDPETVSGFAFGMGIERITMLKYGIGDIRLFRENELRFLRQF
jgi:phenylalanyl-tRNA synthetase alpha chain